MDPLNSYHAISVHQYMDGSYALHYLRMDMATRMMVPETLPQFPVTIGGPWSWEELLLLAASELLQRRVDAEQAVE